MPRMSTDILLVRHGQSVGNTLDLFCGHDDTPLTPLGIAQARALGRRLATTRIDAVIASDLSRAAETARLATHGRGMEVTLDPRLREMFYGEWEALPGKELGEQNPGLMRAFFRGDAAPPGGETVAELRARTAPAIIEIAEAHRGRTVLVVSHGNAMMAMVAELLALPLSATWAFSFANTSLTRLHISKSNRLTVRTLNDSAHIEGLAESHA
jgi:broad specificity phosphatase PhoE